MATPQSLVERKVRQEKTALDSRTSTASAAQAAATTEVDPKQTEEANSIEALNLEMARKFKYPPLSELRKITGPELEKLYADACQAIADYNKTKHISPGSALKLYNLARCYTHGIRLQKSEKTAMYYYNFASNWGYIPAHYNLATLLFIQNPKRAVALLKEAIEYGYTLAYKNLGLCYLRNHGVEPSFDNLKDAYYYLRLSYKTTGDLTAKQSITNCLDFFKKYRIPVMGTEPLPLSYEEELRAREHISADDTEFTYTPDPELIKMQAERFSYLQSYEASHQEIPKTREACLKLARVLFDLARCFFHRLHVAQKDVDLALAYCRKAGLELDFVPAITLLGEYHRKMALVLKKRDQSVKANSAPAAAGPAMTSTDNPAKPKASAAAAAASALQNTPEREQENNPKSHEQQAYEYYLRAANRNYAPAQYAVALLYLDEEFMVALGRTSAKDKHNNARFAFTWLMRSAGHGFGKAKKLITELHTKGFEGIPTNLTNRNISKLLPKPKPPQALAAASAAAAASVPAVRVKNATPETPRMAKAPATQAAPKLSSAAGISAAAAAAAPIAAPITPRAKKAAATAQPTLVRTNSTAKAAAGPITLRTMGGAATHESTLVKTNSGERPAKRLKT